MSSGSGSSAGARRWGGAEAERGGEVKDKMKHEGKYERKREEDGQIKTGERMNDKKGKRRKENARNRKQKAERRTQKEERRNKKEQSEPKT